MTAQSIFEELPQFPGGLSLISKPQFPVVPALPGVPQLYRALVFGGPPLPTIKPNGPAPWLPTNGQPLWGVYDFTANPPKQVLSPDSIMDFDLRAEYRVSDFPVQDGGFASFNKVQVPREYSLRMTKGGSEADRTAFLDQLDSIIADLNLYTILTPEKSYLQVNMTRYELARRGVKGAFWFAEVDVYFKQIRTVTPVFTTTVPQLPNAQAPSALPAVNYGQGSVTAPPAGVVASQFPQVAQPGQ